MSSDLELVSTKHLITDLRQGIVAKHGFLKVAQNRVVDQSGEVVRLRGMSLFWSQWKPQYWTKGTTRWLKKKWGITLLRCPMAIEAGGYLTNPQEEMNKVKTVVEAAIEQGIYVIIDWHDHNAEQHEQEAAEFFGQVAKKYGHHPNVIFEIFNEPIFQAWNTTIKPYHEKIVSESCLQKSGQPPACSALLPGASGDGGWEDCELTESGHFVRSTLLGEPMPATLPEPCPRLTTPPPGMAARITAVATQEDCSKKKCCNDLGAKCFQKNKYWASCKSSCVKGIDPSDPPEWATPWTCKVLTRDGDDDEQDSAAAMNKEASKLTA
eukprot:g15338.t1